ncbi:RHS repeat-associated core domain-containing protein [Oxobacter pfennigii]|uniref:RHS repeat-associated core domain-containing protein n=1 Tax=Oxobacter pfennigii TaxID=36849 RepID=UPI001FA72C12|nr:RHS repeat-associated core domain-containing protein [Oxobacter pfennigii]
MTNDVTHVGYKNPYRYRGYRYDTETGLYYLQSRYYNPEWCRFINADGFIGQIGGLLSHNLFAYSMNNPVNFSDPSGNRRIPSIMDLFEEVVFLIVSLLLVPAVVATPKLIYPLVGSFVDAVVDTISSSSVPSRNIASSSAKTESRATTKTKVDIKTKNKEEPVRIYFVAEATYPGAIVHKKQPLNKNIAKLRLEFGGDIYATTSDDAIYLCNMLGGAIGPTNDGNPKNAMHYHPLIYLDRAHVFFGTDPNLKFID